MMENPKKSVALVIFGLVISLNSFLPAHSNPQAECLVEASPRQHVSLGFPIPEERLHDEIAPRVLVVPFRLSDTPDFVFTPDMKNAFINAGKEIEKLSGGKSKIDFIFNEVVNLQDSVRDMVTLRDNQGRAYRTDESASTFGFVRRVILESDPKIDYRDVDAVYLQGSSNIGGSSIAEAMMFRRAWTEPWFRAIETQEGPILNVVLTDSPKDRWTITHELLHLYGLTDLYGSPAAPTGLSIMAGGAQGLLNHEKWLLGWHANSNVTCHDLSIKSNIDSEVTRFEIPRLVKEHLHVMKLATPGTAMMIETGQRPLGSSTYEYLAFYSLNNEARPPIELHSSKLTSRGDGHVIAIEKEANLELIATILEAKDHSLLISDITDQKIIVDLVRKDAPSRIEAALVSAESKKQERLSAAALRSKSSDSVDKATKPAKQSKVIVCLKGNKSKVIKGAKGKCPKGFSRKK